MVPVSTRRGKEAFTNFSFVYREYTGGISWLKTIEVQGERLSRIMTHWTELTASNQDLVILGGINLCYHKWQGTGDPLQQLIDNVKNIQLTNTLVQLVDQPTRSKLVDGVITDSIIDHVYTNCAY